MAFSPVKECAIKHNIPVFQPKSMKDGEALKIMETLNPDLTIVVAYGKILPKEILYFPKYNSINIHASLLPAYRGAAPIQWSILNGEKITGVTSMLMNEGLDTGDMLLSEKIEITENMNAGELHDALSIMGAEVMSKTIAEVKANSLKPEKQDDSLSNYSPMLSKALCPTDFTKSAQEVHNHIRGLSPWPVATATLNGKKLKLHSSVIGGKTNLAPGTVVSTDGVISVACGDGICVDILSVQAEGKKRMSSKDFLLGHKIEKGSVLSE